MSDTTKFILELLFLVAMAASFWHLGGRFAKSIKRDENGKAYSGDNSGKNKLYVVGSLSCAGLFFFTIGWIVVFLIKSVTITADSLVIQYTTFTALIEWILRTALLVCTAYWSSKVYVETKTFLMTNDPYVTTGSFLLALGVFLAVASSYLDNYFGTTLYSFLNDWVSNQVRA